MSEIKKYIDENEKIVAEGKKDEIANVLGIPVKKYSHEGWTEDIR